MDDDQADMPDAADGGGGGGMPPTVPPRRRNRKPVGGGGDDSDSDWGEPSDSVPPLPGGSGGTALTDAQRQQLRLRLRNRVQARVDARKVAPSKAVGGGDGDTDDGGGDNDDENDNDGSDDGGGPDGTGTGRVRVAPDESNVADQILKSCGDSIQGNRSKRKMRQTLRDAFATVEPNRMADVIRVMEKRFEHPRQNAMFRSIVKSLNLPTSSSSDILPPKRGYERRAERDRVRDQAILKARGRGDEGGDNPPVLGRGDEADGDDDGHDPDPRGSPRAKPDETAQQRRARKKRERYRAKKSAAAATSSSSSKE